MFLAGDEIFTALGIGAMLVVAVAMIGSVTVIPAVLVAARRRAWIAAASRSWVAGRRAAARAGHACGRRSSARRCAGRSRRRVLAGGLLVALAIPALSMHTVVPGTERPAAQHRGRCASTTACSTRSPAGRSRRWSPCRRRDVAVRRRRAPSPRSSAARWRPGTSTAVRRRGSAPTATSRVVDLPMRGDGTNRASLHALAALRGTVVPAALRGTDGVRADVTGMTAGTTDFNALMASRAPLVVLVRADAGVPAAARHVPVDRRAGQGDRAEPAVGRRRVRRARLGLPAGPPGGLARPTGPTAASSAGCRSSCS